MIAVASTPPAPAGAATTWTVNVGGASSDRDVYPQTFQPRVLEVSVGDTVVWKFASFHVTTFLGGTDAPLPEVREGNKVYLNPKVFFPVGGKTYDGTGYWNSGTPPLVPNAPPFSAALTFTKAGRYQYYCAVHGPGMSGVIDVKESAPSGTPEAAVAKGRQEFAATVAAGERAWADTRPNRSGRTVTVPLIGSIKGAWSIFRFTREPLVINRGTTVTWKMADPFEIHTVTFAARGEKVQELVIPQPQQGGPPKLLMNPKVTTPTMDKSYDGREYINSGILYPPGLPGNPPSSYTLTFNRAGRYEYWCIVHVPEGMKGVIVVR